MYNAVRVLYFRVVWKGCAQKWARDQEASQSSKTVAALHTTGAARLYAYIHVGITSHMTDVVKKFVDGARAHVHRHTGKHALGVDPTHR